MAAASRQASDPVRLSTALRDLMDGLEVVDMQVQRCLQMWRLGYRAAERAHVGDYGDGFADATALIKYGQPWAELSGRGRRCAWDLSRGRNRTA